MIGRAWAVCAATVFAPPAEVQKRCRNRRKATVVVRVDASIVGARPELASGAADGDWEAHAARRATLRGDMCLL